MAGYLLDETDQENILRDPEMLERPNEIDKMDKEDKSKSHILYAIDAFIKSVKLKNIVYYLVAVIVFCQAVKSFLFYWNELHIVHINFIGHR